MNFENFKPRLRRLQITPVSQDGEEFLRFYDRAGIAPEAQLPREWAPILARMDGSQTLDEIVEAVTEDEQVLMRGWLEKLVGELDELFYLDSPRFWARQKELEADFLDSPTRPAAFAGLSYPENSVQLRAFLEEKRLQGEKRVPPRAYEPEKVRGIVTPHIDFGRGGHTEAASYAPLRENVKATGKAFDTLVVFGIAHEGVGYPFCATQKSFETPFGVMQCDFDFLNDLQEKVGPQLTQEQLVHKNEHSVEFTAVFAQMFEELKSSKIVPILCGGFWKSLQSGESPEEAEPEVAQFIAALREVTQKHEKSGKKIGFVASVDGSHVGSQFGDETPLNSARLAEIALEDAKWCEAIAAGDRAALHAHFAKDGNRFNVDAHPAVYTLLAAFPQLRGQLLDYDQAYSPSANIVVTFASLALFEP